MSHIRLLLIEDNRLLREGLIAMLAGVPDIMVLDGLGGTESVAFKVRELRPDVVLLDLGLRSHNSLRLVEVVKQASPCVKVVAMDLIPAQSDIVECVEAGVSGFILKDATLDDFVKTIRSVAEGAHVLPASMTNSLFSQIVEHAVTQGKTSLIESVRMTKREREVIALIAEGLSNKEIAQRLNLATHTVKSHVHNILEKLALHTRLEAAAYAHTRGFPSRIGSSTM